MTRLRRWRSLIVGVALATASLGAVVTATPANAAASLTAHFSAADRGSWWLGSYEVRNSGTTASTTWTLEFDLAAGQTVTNPWNGTVTQTGNHVRVTPAYYNQSVPAGGSTAPHSFSFIGGGPTTPPTNCTINGNPCSGAPPVDNPPTAPGTPTGTSTDTTVSLSWAASTDDHGINGYDVYQGESMVKQVAATPTSTVITGLTPDTPYTFKLKARDTINQQSPFSGTLSIRTQIALPPDTQAPTTPGTPTVGSKTSSSVTLNWTASTDNRGVTEYQIYRVTATGDVSAGTVTGAPPAPTSQITGLAADTEYTFKVRAKDGANNLSPFSGTVTVRTDVQPTDHEACRPDGLYKTPGVNVPYCTVYDTGGREKMGADHPRRVIGYFASWRHGKNGRPAYLAKDIPWTKMTHINYAFAHVDPQNRISVGANTPTNPHTGIDWPGVPGAELDANLPYKGHFNLLNKYKRQHGVKSLISVGGWAESGGYINDAGTRIPSGGFYTMTSTQAGINTFADSAVQFIRTYGFDGVDIDYEYATSAPNAGHPDDFQHATPRRATLVAGYVNLMKTLREKLDAASAADGKHYMLTVAATASGWILRGSETYQVTQYLDYLNMMTYDFHGAWNDMVGPQMALYDDGTDAEMLYWNVYGLYGGIGYLNGDWAAHYFRGAMQAGRINLGVGYYSRGWQGVNGGTDGLWGRAPLPNQTQCPPGTGSHVGSQIPCGNGSIGIDNLWYDTDANGNEVSGGQNPIWHIKNLAEGKAGSYREAYGLTPTTDPADRLSGTYAARYSASMAAPWLWNATKKVFLTYDDDQSIQTKANYVASKGLGGIMIWELAGDYAYHPTRDNGAGEYYFGDTLTTKIYDTFKTAAPYGATKANRTMPTGVLNVKADVHGFAVGDANYPISPKLKFTNNSTTTIPGGAVFEFDIAVSGPPTMTQQTGWTLAVTPGHTGNNRGGFRGEFHRVRLTLPTWEPIAPGASKEVQLRYDLPISTPSNYTVTFGGTSYRLSTDNPRTTP
ncbi:chitinase C-terminal domain-containing protein [Rhizohabitans arisaemae]|uniref:chitinase C-terminal domain-containing protein n=1 Tax=Rhizohabitans arisaemae TaxID=2720610 RepID=UPI0024B118DD|nr:glycosyl hydrolase family 18 protein [Rhizohabitans arisaemae]